MQARKTDSRHGAESGCPESSASRFSSWGSAPETLPSNPPQPPTPPTHPRHSPRPPEGGPRAAGVGQSVNLQGCSPGDQVKDRIQRPPPQIFQNKTCQPEEPQVSNQVQPAAMQKVGGEISNRSGVSWNESIVVDNRRAGH